MATRRHVLLGATLGLSLGVVLGTQLPARFRRAEPPAPTLRPSIARAGAPSAADAKAPADAAATPGPKRDAAILRAELETFLARPHRPSVGDWRKQVDALLAEWSATDAHAALAFVAEAPRFPDRARAMGVPLAELFREDAVTAAAWLRSNLNEDEFRSAAEQAIQLLLDDEPQLAFEIAQLDGVPVGRDSFEKILVRLVERSPAEGLAAFARMTAYDQYAVVDGLVRAWAAKNPSSAQEWIRGLTDADLKNRASEAFLEKLAETAPAQVAQAVRVLQPNDSILTSTARVLAKTDSAAAFALLAGLPADDRRFEQRRLIGDTFGVNPDRLYAAAKASFPRDELADVLSSGVTDWLESDRKAADAWLASLDDPALREQLATIQRQNELARDPAKFLEAVDQRALTDNERERIAGAVNILEESNPAQAAAWLSRNPQFAGDFPWRLASSFLEKDESAAIAWITGLPPGELRDRAAPHLARHWLAQGETDAAFAALDALSNPDDRLTAKGTLLAEFRINDEAAALRWLEAQPLAPDDKKALKAVSDAFRRLR